MIGERARLSNQIETGGNTRVFLDSRFATQRKLDAFMPGRKVKQLTSHDQGLQAQDD